MDSSLKKVEDLASGTPEDADNIRCQRLEAFRRAIHAFDDTLARYGIPVDTDHATTMTTDEIEDALRQDFLADGIPRARAANA